MKKTRKIKFVIIKRILAMPYHKKECINIIALLKKIGKVKNVFTISKHYKNFAALKQIREIQTVKIKRVMVTSSKKIIIQWLLHPWKKLERSSMWFSCEIIRRILRLWRIVGRGSMYFTKWWSCCRCDCRKYVRLC